MIKKFQHWLLEKNSKIVLFPGDLAKSWQECGSSDPFVSDMLSYAELQKKKRECLLVGDIWDYGADENVKKLKQKFKTVWKDVETIETSDFDIYRGFSLKDGEPGYDFWNKLLGKNETSSDSSILFIKDKVKYSIEDYSSWTMEHFIASSYADGRSGNLKVVLKTRVKSVKVFANLFEIGDESEELIIYPIKNQEFVYKAWRT
jgi:hypothetical protein